MKREWFESLEKLAKGLDLAQTQSREVLNWLRWYGWLKAGDSLPDVLARVQNAFQLAVTGDLSPGLLRLFHAPRCGRPDILNVDEIPEHSQYRMEPLVLRGRDTTVFLDPSVNSLINGVDAAITRKVIMDGLNAWSKVCDVRFVETTDASSAHILVKSWSRARDGFGASGGVLADAHLLHPGQQVMRIDVAESWWTAFRRGYISLPQVVMHEAGHLINLEHETRRVLALMLPMYSEEFSGIQSPDAERAVKLWGVPSAAIPPAPVGPEVTSQRVTIIRIEGTNYKVTQLQ